MKKFLLSLFVACSALTASAQMLQAQLKDMSELKTFSPKAVKLNVPAEAKASFKQFSLAKSPMKKAAAANDICGSYFIDASEDIHSCIDATISSCNYTDSETGTTYNVEITMYNGYVDVLGVYDEEAGTITIPDQQQCYEVTEDDDLYTDLGSTGKFYLCNANFDDSYTVTGLAQEDIVLEVNEDGTLSFTNSGLYIYMDLDDSTAQYNGYALWMGCNLSMYPVNASQTVTSIDRKTGKLSTEYDYDAYVEDYETSVGVYNAFGFGGYCEMLINDDLTVSVEPGQHMMAQSSSYIQQGYSDYYDLYIYFYLSEDYTSESGNTYKAGWYWSMTEDLTGVLSGNTIEFDDGFGIASIIETDEGTSGYGYFFGGYSLTLNEGNFLADGIKEVNGTVENKIKNTKTYNLMGQQVNRDNAKGLLIYGGKKYIKK